jgi:hypothetical protein
MCGFEEYLNVIVNVDNFFVQIRRIQLLLSTVFCRGIKKTIRKYFLQRIAIVLNPVKNKDFVPAK